MPRYMKLALAGWLLLATPGAVWAQNDEKQAKENNKGNVEKEVKENNNVNVEKQAKEANDVNVEKQVKENNNVNVEKQAKEANDVNVEKEAKENNNVNVEKEAKEANDVNAEKEAKENNNVNVEKEAKEANDVNAEKEANDVNVEKEAKEANDVNVEKEANDVGVIVEEEAAEIVEEAPAYMGQFIDANLVTSSQPYFGRSPEILWAMDLADIGVAEKMAPGSGVLATETHLFITLQDCSLISLNRANPILGRRYRYDGLGQCVGTNSLPVLLHEGSSGTDKSDLAAVAYATGDGSIVAVDSSGAELWRKLVDRRGIPVAQPVVDPVTGAVYTTFNNDFGSASFVAIDRDGGFASSAFQFIPRDDVTAPSKAVVGATVGTTDLYVYGRLQGNHYRIRVQSDLDGRPVSSSLALVGSRGPPTLDADEDVPTLPRFGPAADPSGNGSWAVDATDAVFGGSSWDEEGEPAWAARPANYVGNGITLAGGRVCFGAFDVACHDGATGERLWVRKNLRNGILGDPDVYVAETDGHEEALLVTSLVTGTLYRLDPETGATVWRMDCERDFGVFGVSCDGWNGQTFGMGAMDVSPDGTVVYFSPAPGMLMAAEVFLGPSEAPTLAPTEAPTAAAFAAAQQEQEKDSLAESGAASAVPAALATAAATALTALWIAA